MSALPPEADIAGRQLDGRFVPLVDIGGHLNDRDKGEPWVDLTLLQSRSLQSRCDDRAGCDARRCAERHCRNLRNRETCGPKGCRDHDVRIERVIRLRFFLGKRRLGRTVRAFGGGCSDDKGGDCWNLNRC